MNETYKTTDLYLAAYLKLNGKQLITIERNGRKAQFVFMGECDVEAEDFYNGEAKHFLAYARELRDIKSQMYNELDTDSKPYEREADKENLRRPYHLKR